METFWSLDMNRKADFGHLRSMLATPEVTLSSLWSLLTETKKTCPTEFHTIWVPYLQGFEHVLLRALPVCHCFEDARLLNEIFPETPMEYVLTHESKLPIRQAEGKLFLHMHGLKVISSSNRLYEFLSQGLLTPLCYNLKLQGQKLSQEQWVEIFEHHLTSVTHLSLLHCNITQDTFKQLIHTPGINHLEYFKPGEYGVEQGALGALADSPCMTGLKELDLVDAPLDGACLDKLNETDWAPSLDTLHLCTRTLDDSPWFQSNEERILTRLETMLESPWFQGLTHLSLRVHINVKDVGVFSLHSHKSHPRSYDRACGELFCKAFPDLQLTSLDLRGQHESILFHLRQAWQEYTWQSPSDLKKLNLSYIPMELPLAYPLSEDTLPASPPVHKHMTWLNERPGQYWNQNEGEDHDYQDNLYEDIEPHHLIPGELRIYPTQEDVHVYVQGSGIEQLIHGVWLEGLEELVLSYTGLHTSGLERLMQAPFIPHIQKLDLSNNCLDSSCLEWFLDTSILPRLTHLDLSYNNFSIKDNRQITQHCDAHGIVVRTTDPKKAVFRA